LITSKFLKPLYCNVVYVIVGFYFEHLGLMLSLEEKGLLKDGQYFVVGVDIEQYDRQHPSRYFKGISFQRQDISF
jgi:hypothetical protein